VLADPVYPGELAKKIGLVQPDCFKPIASINWHIDHVKRGQVQLFGELVGDRFTKIHHVAGGFPETVLIRKRRRILPVGEAKEGVVLSRDSRSSEKFMHGIKVLMAKNYIDNLSEEARKGMQEKAEQGIWPTKTPLGYCNISGPDGKKIIAIDPATAPIVSKLFEWYVTGQYSL
jgi:hypothetical protein